MLLPPPSTLIQLNITQKQKLVNMDVNSLKAFSSGDVQHIWEEIKTLYSRSTTSSCKKAHTKEISTVDSDSESQQNVLKINDTHRTGRTKDSTVNKYDDTIPLSASPDITDMDSAEYSNNAASRRDTNSKEMFALLTKLKHVLSYPQIPKLVEPNSSSMQAPKSSTTAVRGRPSGPLLDINGKNGTRLGRRGRHYSEVWQEEDYLEPLSASTQKFQPLSDWGQLLRNYSDNHDGYYRDWLLQTYRGKLEVLRTSKSFKKRRKSDSRMRDSRVLHEDEQRDTLKVLHIFSSTSKYLKMYNFECHDCSCCHRLCLFRYNIRRLGESVAGLHVTKQTTVSFTPPVHPLQWSIHRAIISSSSTPYMS